MEDFFSKRNEIFFKYQSKEITKEELITQFDNLLVEKGLYNQKIMGLYCPTMGVMHTHREHVDIGG